MRGGVFCLVVLLLQSTCSQGQEDDILSTCRQTQDVYEQKGYDSTLVPFEPKSGKSSFHSFYLTSFMREIARELEGEGERRGGCTQALSVAKGLTLDL